jgi:hypothetical protein
MGERIGEAFLKARQAGLDRQGGQPAGEPAADAFDRGVGWVQDVLLPAIRAANQDLAAHQVRFAVDVNLDRRSTNHAHADFWMTRTGDAADQAPIGPRYSINVIGGSEIQLYKQGISGTQLGTIDHYRGPETDKLLLEAAEEYGRLLAAGQP